MYDKNGNLIITTSAEGMKVFEKALQDYYESNKLQGSPDPRSKSNRTPSIEHSEWKEDGQKFSSWKIDCGTGPAIFTGDAGMECFNNALKEIVNGTR